VRIRWTTSHRPHPRTSKVSALDRRDNESGFALLTPGQATGVNLDDVPRVSYLSTPAPNPGAAADVAQTRKIAVTR